jgi:hypothetical protein
MHFDKDDLRSLGTEKIFITGCASGLLEKMDIKAHMLLSRYRYGKTFKKNFDFKTLTCRRQTIHSKKINKSFQETS